MNHSEKTTIKNQNKTVKIKKTQKNTLKTGESEKSASENSLQRSNTEHPSMIETP
jgi:hypothetical protein